MQRQNFLDVNLCDVDRRWFEILCDIVSSKEEKRKKVFFDSSRKFKKVFWQDDTTQPTMSCKFQGDRLSRHEAAYVRLREPFRGSILRFICSQLKCKRSFFELREKRLVLVEFLTRENRSFAIGCSSRDLRVAFISWILRRKRKCLERLVWNWYDILWNEKEIQKNNYKKKIDLKR